MNASNFVAGAIEEKANGCRQSCEGKNPGDYRQPLSLGLCEVDQQCSSNHSQPTSWNSYSHNMYKINIYYKMGIMSVVLMMTYTYNEYRSGRLGTRLAYSSCNKCTHSMFTLYTPTNYILNTCDHATEYINSSYLTVIVVHEMHGRMHHNHCQITNLLAHDPPSSLAYPWMTHPLSLASN